MAATIQFKRKINGTGSPGAAGAKEGEIAIAFPGAAGGTTKPEIWCFDGVAYRKANPDVTVTTQSLAFSAAADIGAAYTAWAAANVANKIAGDVVIATFGTPPQAYVLTNPALPSSQASWTSLGGAVSFANSTEIATGTDTTKAINPAGLRGASVAAPTGGAAAVAGDADKLVRLDTGGSVNPALLPRLVSTDGVVVTAGVAINGVLTPAGLESRVAHAPNANPATDVNKLPALDATGKIPTGFLPVGGLNFAGALDPTKASPAPPAAGTLTNGAFYSVSAAGAVDATWKPKFANAGLTTVAIGDYMVWDAATAKFHHIANAIDMSAYVPLAGTTQMTGNILWSGAAGSKSGTVIMNGKMGEISDVVLNCGTY